MVAPGIASARSMLAVNVLAKRQRP